MSNINRNDQIHHANYSLSSNSRTNFPEKLILQANDKTRQENSCRASQRSLSKSGKEWNHEDDEMIEFINGESHHTDQLNEVHLEESKSFLEENIQLDDYQSSYNNSEENGPFIKN